MRIHDTALGKLVNWTPPHDIRIYVCGITPYDSAHLGHILTFMTYDILQRYLEDQGYAVTMVRNITDVDEPIYTKAAELGIPYTELAERETMAFHKVLERLHFRPLAHEPRASQYIEQMAEAVEQLLDAGHAYYLAGDDDVDSDIYFDTASLPKSAAFGSFSGFSPRLLRGLFAGRGGDSDRPGKRQPLDFLLWKAVTDATDPAAWDAGRNLPHGRPGWHIECSVMSSQLLGTPFDLHGGGNDLIFPHHESEIAQTSALDKTGSSPQLASHWMHVAPLHYCGEKMSKSLGNLVFARDLLERYEPSVIRLALMNYHYRIGGEWNPCFLAEAVDLLHGLRMAVDGGAVSLTVADDFASRVRSALADNLDTHAIMHALRDMAALSVTTPSASPEVTDIVRTTLELLGLSLTSEPA